MARQRKTADEKDYLDPATRHYFTYRAGKRKAIKTGANRRDRRQARVGLRDGQD